MSSKLRINLDTGEGLKELCLDDDLFDFISQEEFEGCLDIFRTLLLWQREIPSGKENEHD